MFSNNPWLAAKSNITQGFDELYNNHHFRHLGRFSIEFLFEKWGTTELVPWFDTDFGAAQTNHLIDRWLQARAGDETPVFVFANFMETHMPYVVPRKYRAAFMSDEQVHRSYQLRQMAYGRLTTALNSRFNIEGGSFLPETDRDVLNRQYLGCIRYLDDRVRELIAVFDRRGLLDRTLVVITSDHGEHLGTHEMWSHRWLTYDEVSHICLILREPGRKAGARTTAPVQLSDIHYTLLNTALGIDNAASGFGSYDLFTAMEDGAAARMAVVECYGEGPLTIRKLRTRNDPELIHRVLPQKAVVGERYKYMRSSDGREELYDLAEDPGELRNLMIVRRDVSAPMAAYLARWLREVPRYKPAAEPQAGPPSSDWLESLRSLGYLDDGQDESDRSD
jgi:arylsulfatase A-like enzyme